MIMTIFEFAESATREMSSLATGRHVLTSDGVNEEDSQRNIQGGDEAVPDFGAHESFCESNTEPLLGRPVS